MSINLETATTEEIIAEYGVGIIGITEGVDIIANVIDQGIDRNDPAAAVELVEGFEQGVALLDSLPADLRETLNDSPAGEVLGAGRLLVDLHKQAVAAGRVSTPLALGLALADLGFSITRLDAANGNVRAQEALKSAEAQGLL